MPVDVHPATPERLDDLLDLFGPHGAFSNCWCTWWLLKPREFDATPSNGRRALLTGLVQTGSAPGLLAYRDGEAVGWCALGPRSRYARMMSPRSRSFRPVDDNPDQWVVNCFFVRARREGVARNLLSAAVEFAHLHGASRLEAYPVDTTARAGMRASDLYTGTLSMFLAAGFEEVGRPNGRPLVRLAFAPEATGPQNEPS